MKFREVTKDEFRQFASHSSADNFLQSVEMYDRYEARGNEAYLVGLFDRQEMVAAALLVSKRSVLGQKIFNCPRGFLLDYAAENANEIFAEMTEKTAKFLKEKNAMVLVTAPNLTRIVPTDEKGNKDPKKWVEGRNFTIRAKELGYKPLGEYEFAKWIYTLPLAGLTEDSVVKSFRSGHREAIRLAPKRYGVRLRELSYDELNILDEIVHESGVRHGFPDPGLKYYQEMAKAYGNKIKFLVAEVPRKVISAHVVGDRVAMDMARMESEQKEVEMTPVAAAMFVFWRNEVVYLYSGSRSEYKKFGGPHLIQAEIIKEAIRAGVPSYNFYGVMPVPGDGVYEFKRGFRGQVEEFVGTFMLPLTLRGKIFTLRQKYSEMKNVH